jgi:hypothetical protein
LRPGYGPAELGIFAKAILKMPFDAEAGLLAVPDLIWQRFPATVEITSSAENGDYGGSPER